MCFTDYQRRRGPASCVDLTDNLDPGSGHHEPGVQARSSAHCRKNLVLQVPRQYQYVVGMGFDQLVRMENRDVGAGRVFALFVWIAVDREVDEIRADAAIIE